MINAVVAVLNEYDLSGLDPGEVDGAPVDEYINEALAISGPLLRGRTLERADVVRVWLHWFEDDLRELTDEHWESLLGDLNALRVNKSDS